MHVVGDIAEVDIDRETLPYRLRRIARSGPQRSGKRRARNSLPAPAQIVRLLRIKQRRFLFDLGSTRVDGKG